MTIPSAPRKTDEVDARRMIELTLARLDAMKGQALDKDFVLKEAVGFAHVLAQVCLAQQDEIDQIKADERVRQIRTWSL